MKIYLRHYAVAAGMAILVSSGILSAALAEDEVATQARVFRGRVLSVDAQGIRIALTSGGETVIPRSLVVGTPKVTPPPSILNGIEAYEKGNLKEAQRNLSKVAMQYRGLDVDWVTKSLVYYARACLAAGEVDKAGQAFDAFLDAYEDDPLAIAARIGKAKIKLFEKNYDEALAGLRELAEVYDKQLKPSNKEMEYAAEIYCGIGQCLADQSNETEALNAYLKVTALYPAEAYYPEALYRAAGLYRKLDQPQKAAPLYDELIEDYPDNALVKKAIEEKAALPRAESSRAGAKP
ncbi:MAG: tetratricopeptide repeat protein [Kiritimatiellae bacterium]|nr:tetratricopeptide repeat protein [Kiritimatiellia bacterium]